MSDTIELIDIYDENRELTGVILPRGTFLAPGQFQLYALAMICDAEGRILITQRSQNESWGAGWWEIPGGGVRAGEEPDQAVLREIGEETGLDVSDAEGGYVFSYKRVNPEEKNNYFVDIYKFVMELDEADVRTQEEEVAGFKLAQVEEIREYGEQGIFLHYDSIKRVFE